MTKKIFAVIVFINLFACNSENSQPVETAEGYELNQDSTQPLDTIIINKLISYLDKQNGRPLTFAVSCGTLKGEGQDAWMAYRIILEDSILDSLIYSKEITNLEYKYLFEKYWCDRSAWDINVILNHVYGISNPNIRYYRFPDRQLLWKQEGMKEDSTFWYNFFAKLDSA